jgi:hypothetical protein
VGMSGMSLVSGYWSSTKAKGTGSTFFISPDDREDSASQQMTSAINHDQSSFKGSALPLPTVISSC